MPPGAIQFNHCQFSLAESHEATCSSIPLRESTYHDQLPLRGVKRGNVVTPICSSNPLAKVGANGTSLA
jgi:hypothetical protein